MRPRRSFIPESFSDSDGATESATQAAMRLKEERLVQSALARIRKAQEKGKKDVKLHEDELKALERRRKRLEAEAKKKSSSSSSDKERRRKNDRMITVPLGQIEQPKRKNGRRLEEGPKSRGLPTMNGSGFLLEADDQSYAPIGSYPVSLIPAARGQPSRPRSSSSSKGSARQPLPQMQHYQAFNPGRHVSEGYRPSSSSSHRRALPDEELWEPGSRRSSTSSAIVDPFDYQIGPDTARARRGVSGPADIIYSDLPWRPPQHYVDHPRAPFAGPYGAIPGSSSSDPLLARQQLEPELSETSSSSSSSDSDGQTNGVPVDSPARDHRHPSPAVVPARKPVGGGHGKKRDKK